MTARSIMEDKIPDHVSMDRTSSYFFQYCKKVGVKIDGEVVFNCVEFCVSGRWAQLGIRNYQGKLKQERGKYLTVKRSDVTVEPYWR